ncbi:MAG: hypothetical protein R2713_06570 [Ilumatobacteraceae bacterium]
MFFTSHTFPGPGNSVAGFLADFEAATGGPIETIAFGALGADATG